MKFDIPLAVTFRSKIKEGKFFTMDEEKEVKAPYYAKNIKSVDDLTDIEVHYVLIKYSTFNKHLEQISRFMAKMKI